VGPRADLDAVVKRKIPSPYLDLNPPNIQPVTQSYTTELSRLNVGQHYNLMMANETFENVANLKCLRTIVTNQLHSGTAE
jgi:hypothetical protein